MRVVAYVRVSTEEQASEGLSLDAQRSRLAAYAELYGLDLVAVEIDAGVSAKSLDRPGLRAALARLDRGEAAGLVVAKLDRLSRSVADWNALIDGYFGEKAGRTLMSVADSIDTRTAAGRLVLNVLMSVAQWEREAVAERTREVLRHKREQGEHLGQVPVGFAVAPDGRTLVPDPDEQRTLALIRELKAAGLSLRAIAAELTRRQIPAKRGGTKWTHSTIADLLRREPPTDAAQDRPHPPETDPGPPQPDDAAA